MYVGRAGWTRRARGIGREVKFVEACARIWETEETEETDSEGRGETWVRCFHVKGDGG